MTSRVEARRDYVRERVSVPAGLHAEIATAIRSTGRWMDFGEYARAALREKVERDRAAVVGVPVSRELVH